MSIGSTLRQARESAGLPLSVVSERTSMRQTLIAAIERDDFSLSGGDVYARGHIRSIARAIGIDGEVLVAEYDTIYGNPNESLVDLIDSSPMLVKPRRNPWQPAMAAAGVALFVIAGIAITQGDSERPAAQPTASSPTTSSPTAPDSSEEESDAIANAGDGVTFVVNASAGASWISVRDANDNQIFQGILAQGQTRTFTDDTNLRVVIGNAGGLQISVNGRDLGYAGKPGAVVRFNLTPGDPGIG